MDGWAVWKLQVLLERQLDMQRDIYNHIHRKRCNIDAALTLCFIQLLLACVECGGYSAAKKCRRC